MPESASAMPTWRRDTNRARRAVELLRGKYGPEWVADWYLDIGRIPVKLRLGA